ncbi:EAL domain-containing protein [Neobacillus niacini]|uniref:sensor domain-containing protein n=1 Tax=Neobacillus niacini TaxID=86668 RepID=UPI002FFEEDD3
MVNKTEKIKILIKELADINLALNASTIVAITDNRGTITFVNDKFCELSMYNENELIGQNHRMLKSGYHSKEFFSAMWKTISSGEIWKGEIRNKAKDGSFYWVDTTIVPFMNEQGQPYQYVSIRTDITKRVKMESELQEAMKRDFIHTVQNLQRELQENQQHYQSLFEHSHDFVFTYDKSGKVINMNPRAIEIFGRINETKHKEMIVKEYLDIRKLYFERAVQGTPQNFELEMINKNGERLFFNINFLPIFVDKQIKGVFSIGKDITEQKKVQEMNAYFAHHDELTRLPNRRWIEHKLDQSLRQAKENRHVVAVLFIDLDRFKYINDTLGHFIGDQVLKLISKRLLESLNQDCQYVARMGGDEFMVLCTDIKQLEEAYHIASIILQNLSNPLYIEDFELFVSASIGISSYPTDGESVVDLMKKADTALYRAKDQGRNTYQMYSASMDERSYQSFLLERNLRKAIINNEFIAHFQPQFDANTGKIIGAEALIRWMHPELGLVSPGEFIPLAEESGLIIPIGKWMKRKVCEQLAAWREAGIPFVPISVNISSQRFLQKDFPKEVRQLLEEYQLDGKWIVFEITENSLMKNEEYIIQTINELKDLGIKIYIDDFGTGYSSFNYLKMFKLDGIKIDRTFIHTISKESENAGITIAMIKMAHHLKMDVIAEGVETTEELEFLREQNCHQIQGFLYGGPCDSQEFEKGYL